MLYVQWVPKVLDTMETCENDRARLMGLPPAALREPLGVDLSDVDAIEDALYDLEALGLAQRRPAGTFNLTTLGRLAAAQSIEDVGGASIQRTCRGLTDDERRFVQALLDLSQTPYDGFARARYVDLEQGFDKTRLHGSHEQQETFLLPLVVSTCIDYQEFVSARVVRPLFTGVICASVPREQARPGVAPGRAQRVEP